MALYVHDSSQQQRGPFDVATVLAMLERGELDDRALCCAEGEAQWIPIRQHPAVASALASAAPLGWGAAATPWSIGAQGGATWSSNSVPPSAGWGTNTGASIQPAAVSAAPSAHVASPDEEAEEDAAMGIPIEVTRPPSVVPSAMGAVVTASAPVSAAATAPVSATASAPVGATASGGALAGARFVGASVASATTAADVAARREARAAEGRAKTKVVAAVMLGGGVLLLGALVVGGWSKRRAARDELTRASVPHGQLVTSALAGTELTVDLSLSDGTRAQGVIEPGVRCDERPPPARAPSDTAGTHRQRFACDVSERPFGEQQRLRFRIASVGGTGEIAVTFVRPPELSLTRDPASGDTRIECRGLRCRGTFTGRDGLSLDVAARTTVRIGPVTRESTADGVLRVQVPFESLLASTRMDAVFAQNGEVPLDLSLDAPGGVRVRGSVQLPAAALRAELYRSWRPGQPVLLQGEVPSGAGRRTLVAEHGESFGAPAQLRDVDLVAFYRESPQTRACRYVIAPRERRVTTLRRVDAVLTVFERRTARAVGQRRFNAEFAPCPAEYSESAPATTTVDPGAITAWLRAFVSG